MRRDWGWGGLGLFQWREEMAQPGSGCHVQGEHSHFQVGRLFHVILGGRGTLHPLFIRCLPCVGHYTVCVPWVILYLLPKGVGAFITSLLSRNKGSERFSRLPSITVLGFTTGMDISVFSPSCLHGKELFPALC